MKKKRILAWIGIAILASMYLMDLILALSGSPAARQWLTASLVCTAAIPVLLYGFLVVTGRTGDKKDGPESGPPKEPPR